MELSRVDAIALLAYSMAAADGQIGPAEEAAIEERLRQRGMQVPSGRLSRLRQVADNSRDGISVLLRPVCEALPEEHQRIEAMRLALDVVLADDAFHGSEMAQVLQVADELGIERAEASRLIQERA